MKRNPGAEPLVKFVRRRLSDDAAMWGIMERGFSSIPDHDAGASPR